MTVLACGESNHACFGLWRIFVCQFVSLTCVKCTVVYKVQCTVSLLKIVGVHQRSSIYRYIDFN